MRVKPIRVIANDVILSTDPQLGSSDSVASSQKAVKEYADNISEVINSLVYKGEIDCSLNPNYPAANAGYIFRISENGKIGGEDGIYVVKGTIILCYKDDSISGSQETVGDDNWDILQNNLDFASSEDAINGTESTKIISPLTLSERLKSPGIIGSDNPDDGTFKNLISETMNYAGDSTGDVIRH